MKALLGILFILVPRLLFADEAIDLGKIQSLVSVFKKGVRSEIVCQLAYPIRRQYPLPSIHSPSEALELFDQLFDAKLLSLIQNSIPKDDWQLVGWRGVMFLDGILWLNTDYHIYAINSQTELEKKAWDQLVESGKLELPVELKNFDTPISRWKTNGFLVRVDQVNDNYRLILWKTENLSQPDKVLADGVVNSHGTIGTYNLDWTDGKWLYRVEEGTQYLGELPSLYIFDRDKLTASSEAAPILEEKALMKLDE